jgi:hypothetical protein
VHITDTGVSDTKEQSSGLIFGNFASICFMAASLISPGVGGEEAIT